MKTRIFTTKDKDGTEEKPEFANERGHRRVHSLTHVLSSLSRHAG